MDKSSQEQLIGGVGSGISSRIHTVQPLRDLESNWGVDLAKSLEDYLFKICSGELSSPDDDARFSVNFTEAALLLQGSIQVYSKKVEYLYSLVLHALDFISQKRPQEQEEGGVQPEAVSSNEAHVEDNDQFWYGDDIPVEAKNSLDDLASRDVSLNHFIKPPANLVVLEGDCLDSTGDGGELESYLLATNDLYRDFILLDLCDAVVVDEFLNGEKVGEVQHSAFKGTPLNSKVCRNFLSPFGHSGKTAQAWKENLGDGTEDNDDKARPSAFEMLGNGDYEFDMDYNDSGGVEVYDMDSDDEDPWKPLNPHEPGNLKVKPFRKVNFSRLPWARKKTTVAEEFPLAKRHGPISPQLTKIWEMQRCPHENNQGYQSPPFFEKLRESLIHGDGEIRDGFCHPEYGDGDNDASDDGNHYFEKPDFDIPGPAHVDEDMQLQPEQQFPSQSEINEPDGLPMSQTSLEGLCRAHLDSLLTSIAETENQMDLVARVSTWKQRIKHNLEEQDARPPFDIHEYGERVFHRLPVGGDFMSFGDVVTGQEKHDVARTFSSLLQLVNDRKVDLERDGAVGESLCYTGVNPFYVRLTSQEKRQQKAQFPLSKKGEKSPVKRGRNKGKREQLEGQSSVVSSPSLGSNSTQISPPLQTNCKFSVKISKLGALICTPEGKRRRRSRCVKPVNLHLAG